MINTGVPRYLNLKLFFWMFVRVPHHQPALCHACHVHAVLYFNMEHERSTRIRFLPTSENNIRFVAVWKNGGDNFDISAHRRDLHTRWRITWVECRRDSGIPTHTFIFVIPLKAAHHNTQGTQYWTVCPYHGNPGALVV